MATIPVGSLPDYSDGDVVYAIDYNRDREVIRVAINDIETWLASVVVGEGAEKIGISPVVGLVATTVRGAIAELQTKIADLIIEQIPLNSITLGMIESGVIGDKVYAENNYITDLETLTASLDKLDIQLKDVTDNAASAQTKIGSQLYAENNYIADLEALSTSLDKLDMAIKDRADEIGNRTYSVNNYVTDLESLTASIEKLDLAVAGIIDAGSNANGSYIKFEDGTMIAVGYFTPSVAVNTAGGSIFYGTYAWTFPLAFYAAPTYINANVERTGAILWGGGSPTATVNGYTFYLISGSSLAAALTGVRCIAIGRWKA